MRTRRGATGTLAGALLLTLTACSSGTSSAPPTRTPTPTPTASPSPAPTTTTSTAPSSSAPSGPAPSPPATRPADCGAYAAPDPHRPVVTVDLTVAGATVRGTERVLFTPDRPITELVFRLWASAPRPAAAGGSSSLTTARVDGAPVVVSRPQPTLVLLPHRGRAGRPVTIDLGFTVTLPTGANDRFGHRGSTSWFASAVPLLAWERGRGWATEPATSAFAEASTSEDARLARLTVHHAAGLTVVSTGDVVAQDATTTVTAAPAVRDLAVAVGRFTTARRGLVQVARDPGVPDDPAAVATEVARALRAHAARFGPFPYGRLQVAVLPDIKGGIEYPGVILLGTDQLQDSTASHEVAHEWFYGLVGDDQARDPWLDEAFATYAEALDRGTADQYLTARIPADGLHLTGAPMTYWEGRPAYFRSVYVQGAAALLRARTGRAAAFDAQVRCYVARNAHRIATPADVARSIPLAVAALRTAGALRRP